VANPAALLLAAALMLDHAGLAELATRLRTALRAAVVSDGVRTRDLGGSAGTAEMTKAIIARLG
jgi:isocitrate dehydrogenase (NAD+)